MRVIGNLILCVLFLSCSIKKYSLDTPSKYIDTKDRRFFIQIEPDSTFVLQGSTFAGGYGCEGRWLYIDTNKILLKCADVKNPLEVIAAGYLVQREHVIYLLSNRKIKYENRILRRVE